MFLRLVRITPIILVAALFTGCSSGGGGDSPGPDNTTAPPETTAPTGTSPDTTAPSVTSTTPENGVAGVAVNSGVIASFSEAMDCATITTASFTVTDATGPVSGTVSCAGNSATFTPATGFAYSATYTALITTGAKDTAGNPLAANYSWTFTTGAAPDTTPPTISSTTPANSATGVSLGTAPSVTFSEPMDCTSLTTSTFTLSGGVTGAVACTGNTATLTPANPLTGNTTYTATVTTGVKDVAGNALAANYSWSFTTLLPPPAAPTLSLGFGIKQLRFSWSGSSGADYYRLLENPDGASGFTQWGSNIGSGRSGINLDVAVHRHDWANARYLLEACNAAGCTSSNEVSTMGTVLQAIGYVKASNTGANDMFGAAVALSADGQTLAVAAPFEGSAATGVNDTAVGQSNDSASFAGAVYIYARSSDGTWSQTGYVKPSNTKAGMLFGSSLALSSDGSTLAVGAASEDSAATGINGDEVACRAGLPGSPLVNCALDSGAVYVFIREGSGGWTQQAYVKASNTGAGDYFGIVSLSADGNTLAVGAPSEDSASTDPLNNDAPNAGAVYVFVRTAGTWTQERYLKASNVKTGDWFGRSLSLSSNGNTLAIGATMEDSAAQNVGGNQTSDCGVAMPVNCAVDSGAVYLFDRVYLPIPGGGTAVLWSQMAYIKASNTGAGDRFGTVALSADGSTLAVGAAGEDSAATGAYGSQTSNAAADAGAVYVFAKNAGAWEPQAYLKASNTEGGDSFGVSVAISSDGNSLAVGATGEDSNGIAVYANSADNTSGNAGAVYLFSRTGSTWTAGQGGLAAYQGYIKAPNTGSLDRFGSSIALSGDGSTLAVGAEAEASSATGINGNQYNESAVGAGAAYLY